MPSLPNEDIPYYNGSMHDEKAINSIQAGILRTLQLTERCRFAELNTQKVPSDQFSYHLRQLVKYGLIEKHADNTYSLSRHGRTRTLMLYDNKDGFIEQGFLAVRLVLTRSRHGRTEYLVHERGTAPYRGTYSTPGNKIFFGEDILPAAQRILAENTGLSCGLELKGLHHARDYYEGELMQDKYFFVCSGKEPTGELIVRPGRRELWLTLDELRRSDKTLQGTLEMIEIAQQAKFSFSEAEYHPETY